MANRIITINRLYGSSGRLLGKALSEELGIPFYDKELLRIASEKSNIPYKDLEKADEKCASQWYLPIKELIRTDPQYLSNPLNNVLFEAQSKIIRELADKGDCIIVGRCANHILRDKCCSIFIHAPFEYRVKSIVERLGREEKSARSLVKKMDKERKYYYEYFTDKKWTDLSQYHLCIDSSQFSQEHILALLKTVYFDMK